MRLVDTNQIKHKSSATHKTESIERKYKMENRRSRLLNLPVYILAVRVPAYKNKDVISNHALSAHRHRTPSISRSNLDLLQAVLST